MLGIETRASNMLGKWSTSELYQEPYLYFLFWDSLTELPRVPLNSLYRPDKPWIYNPFTSAYQASGITGL